MVTTKQISTSRQRIQRRPAPASRHRKKMSMAPQLLRLPTIWMALAVWMERVSAFSPQLSHPRWTTAFSQPSRAMRTRQTQPRNSQNDNNTKAANSANVTTGKQTEVEEDLTLPPDLDEFDHPNHRKFRKHNNHIVKHNKEDANNKTTTAANLLAWNSATNATTNRLVSPYDTAQPERRKQDEQGANNKLQQQPIANNDANATSTTSNVTATAVRAFHKNSSANAAADMTTASAIMMNGTTTAAAATTKNSSSVLALSLASSSSSSPSLKSMRSLSQQMTALATNFEHQVSTMSTEVVDLQHQLEATRQEQQELKCLLRDRDRQLQQYQTSIGALLWALVLVVLKRMVRIVSWTFPKLVRLVFGRNAVPEDPNEEVEELAEECEII